MALSQARGDSPPEQFVGRDDQGRIIYRSKPVNARFNNPADPQYEAEFQQRAARVIAAQSKLKVPAGNTYFENEKRTYGYLMAQVLAGRDGAIADLQVDDAQANQWHRETRGIDFYACFTLKHQTRKYFLFGDLLEPDYRKRMFEGARAWTAQDPLLRPHYAFDKPGEGWGPDQRNSWVDVRTTENLHLMRISSVYLFAEETGNRATADKYKQQIRRYAHTLFRAGIGEWDSENYHGHSLAPLCNLFDFAKDEQVRLWAKACLDWFYAAGAVKYYRGAFGGPTKRDYNHPQPFGGSAANMLWLHFGDSPIAKTDRWESDEVHVITSAYRPPQAVIAMARKRFDRPVELFSVKPHYAATTTGDTRSPPEHYETMYFGRTYQLGSLTGGTSEDGGDVNGFKMLIESERRGAEAIQCVPGPDPLFVGSPMYQKGKVAGPNRVAQFENCAVWLVRNGKAPWCWVVPQSVRIHAHGPVTILECDRSYVAIHPLGTEPLSRDDSLTAEISRGESARFPDHQVLRTRGTASAFCGFAIEAGDRHSHGNLTEFTRRAMGATIDASKLDEGIIQFKTADGRWLGFHWHDDPRQLGVWRNGRQHDWTRHAQYLYRTESRGRPPLIESRWGEGRLEVSADGKTFRCEVADDGRVIFTNSP